MPDINLPPNPQVPQITLAPGLTPVPDYRRYEAPIAPVKVPEGFTPIFNGRDLFPGDAEAAWARSCAMAISPPAPAARLSAAPAEAFARSAIFIGRGFHPDSPALAAGFLFCRAAAPHGLN